MALPLRNLVAPLEENPTSFSKDAHSSSLFAYWLHLFT
jgi:hypothetical protein